MKLKHEDWRHNCKPAEEKQKHLMNEPSASFYHLLIMVHNEALFGCEDEHYVKAFFSLLYICCTNFFLY